MLENSLKSTISEKALAVNMRKRPNCFRNLRERFYHVLLSFSWKLIWNMSPLVSGEILETFVDTLTGDGRYPVQGCENLQLPIQMKLSEKQKILSQFFFPFLESKSNLKHFERKDDCHS